MTLSLSTLKKSGRAALVALAMGAVSMTAMPVQAAEPNFNFQLGIGNDGGVMGFELNNKKNFNKFKKIKKCLTNSQVEHGLEWYGFDDADVVKKLSSSRVLVIAEWNNKYYSMTVNKCTGEVYNVKRLKKGFDFYDDDYGYKGPKGGFGFEKDGFSFQFGIN
jgi:hypothetical protein